MQHDIDYVKEPGVTTADGPIYGKRELRSRPVKSVGPPRTRHDLAHVGERFELVISYNDVYVVVDEIMTGARCVRPDRHQGNHC